MSAAVIFIATIAFVAVVAVIWWGAVGQITREAQKRAWRTGECAPCDGIGLVTLIGDDGEPRGVDCPACRGTGRVKV